MQGFVPGHPSAQLQIQEDQPDRVLVDGGAQPLAGAPLGPVRGDAHAQQLDPAVGGQHHLRERDPAVVLRTLTVQRVHVVGRIQHVRHQLQHRFGGDRLARGGVAVQHLVDGVAVDVVGDHRGELVVDHHFMDPDQPFVVGASSAGGFAYEAAGEVPIGGLAGFHDVERVEAAYGDGSITPGQQQAV
ncbi:MAG: hypothetical protein GY898_19045 [Proteobacteria bacterium]|nr:hypothetical protein [Pseudomonadota bacterium]